MHMERSDHRFGARGWIAVGVLAAVVGGGIFIWIRSDRPVPPVEATVPPVVLADPLHTYDPVKAGEALPEGFREVVRRDVIAPVYDPQFVAAESVDWGPETLVVGVALDGEAKAYPVNYMNVHEMVNDRIAGSPILVSWCPLCGTAMVHRREIDGVEVVFGNQGALWHNAMTWWDHDTGSIWSQPLGEAILGELRGTKLELLPSTLSYWDAWVSAHPDTLAIDTFGAPMVISLHDLAIVVDLGAATVAYPYEMVVRRGVINDVVAGVEIAVVVDPRDEDRWAVLSRRLDEGTVDLQIVDGELVDSKTGSAIDPVRGLGLDGPLQGEVLALLPAGTVFPEDFGSFWPNGRFWSESG